MASLAVRLCDVRVRQNLEVTENILTSALGQAGEGLTPEGVEDGARQLDEARDECP